MQRLFIQILNFAWLFIVLVGVPAATRVQFGSWQICSAPAALLAIFWGLGLAVVLNFIGAWKILGAKKSRLHCLAWTLVFAGLWLAYLALVRGWVSFAWLKQMLLWLQKYL